MKYYPPEGLLTNLAKEGRVKISSSKYNEDENYQKPLNEVSEEIRRRKNRIKISSI